MEEAKPVKVSPPPLIGAVVNNLGYPNRNLTDFLYKLWMRTGGSTDKAEAVRLQAAIAQAAADAGIGSAETAQELANAAQEAADAVDVTAGTAQLKADDAYVLADTGQVPIGGIMPIAGGFTIPTNWALCDGANGTPDLRGQFIIGAKDVDYPAGTTGGSAEYTGNTDDSTATTTSTDTTGNSLTTTTAQAAAGVDVTLINAVSLNDTGHSHDETVHNHSMTLPTIPPYYALAYIMRTA